MIYKIRIHISKKAARKWAFTYSMLMCGFLSFAQNVGINATGAAPASSALLDLSSPNSGFLITRADTANIPSPALGLMTLAPSDSCLYMFNGSSWMGLDGVGSSCRCNCRAVLPPPPATSPCRDNTTTVTEVITATGKIWMDRNLGASQVAGSETDVASYGNLYQWGRCTDGHEKRTSKTDGTASTADNPGHGGFIIYSGNDIRDWRDPQNSLLWQGAAGQNNPCPTGYRLPTSSELDAERGLWATNDAFGAYNSVLKLPLAGYRDFGYGSETYAGTYGFYWTSTIAGTKATFLYFYGADAFMHTTYRGDGCSLRCIQD